MCPVCGSFPRVGDGAEGLLAEHPVRFRPWAGSTGPSCAGSGLTITAARDLAAGLLVVGDDRRDRQA